MGLDPLPRMLANRYRLERKLGHGGMGVVYGAVDTTMRRPVAIKLISPDPDAETGAVERFMREARNTARIRHPNIVHLFDLGRSQTGELFFVMELLDGVSLSQFIKATPKITQETAVHIARQVCAALGYAHENGIIHRDLKPANIMLMRTPEEPYLVKVLDFGVAKAQDQETQLTRTGMLVGTVEYMAPEQIKGAPVDPRTDIYALGVILFRMLTGKHPFPEGSAASVIQHQLKTLPRSPREMMPDREIAESLDALVLRCLAKRPEARFATMADLDDALLRALSLEDPYPSWDPTAVGPNDPRRATPPAARNAPTAPTAPTAREGVEATRIEGRVRNVPQLPNAQMDTDLVPTETLVMATAGKPTPLSGEMSVRPPLAPTFIAPAAPPDRLRIQPIYVLVATIIFTGALGYALLQGFDSQSLVTLGVGIILATVTLVLGVRKPSSE